MLSWAEHEKKFYNLEARSDLHLDIPKSGLTIGSLPYSDAVLRTPDTLGRFLPYCTRETTFVTSVLLFLFTKSFQKKGAL